MKLKYQYLVIAFAAVTFVWPAQEVAAQDTLNVDWADTDGFTPVKNALRNAIANDTLADGSHVMGRIYKLRRGGFYWNEDRIAFSGYHLHIVGATSGTVDDNVCGTNQDQDCGLAIIQRVVRADQSIDGVMIENSGSESHLTVENVWFMGQDDNGTRGSYEQIQLNAADSRLVFNNVVFDRNFWHFLGPNAEGNDMFVTNSVFRNIFGNSQQWEGLGVRFEVGADTVVFENNTFLNIGFTPFQSEAAPMNYFRANHNTFVNVGRNFQAGALWKESYVVNNVFVNPFWHGEGFADYSGDGRVDSAGFFAIGALPARYGTNFDREIVFANNSFWRDPDFAAYYADSIWAQPVVSDTTMGYFNQFSGNMVMKDIKVEDPVLTTYPPQAVIDGMIANISDLRAGITPATMYYWDDGRNEADFVNSIFPLPEDFSYTNANLLSAGTDGLPIGDLNWFPASKTDWEGRKEAEIAKIEGMAEGVDLEPIELTEGEDGTLGSGATVYAAPGFKHFFMQGSGFIRWTFDVPSDGEYGLNVITNMRTETQRGQHVRVNGTGLRNNSSYGEYYFCTAAITECAVPLAANTWETVEIRAADLIAGAEALTLTAGMQTVEIAPSWGWQGFAGLQVVDGTGTVIHDLDALDAYYEGVEATCDEADYCPQFFKAAEMGAGGTVSWDFNAPYNGNYMLRVFYQTAEAPVAGQMWVDGSAVSSVSYAGAAGELGGRDLFTDQFALTTGMHTLALSADDAGLRVDYVQLIGFGATGTDKNELPEGYALEQNYPNPFNPNTAISFTIPVTQQVRLAVYDLLGRHVKTLVDGNIATGSHLVNWDGRSGNGSSVASGVYFYRLDTNEGYQVRKMVMLK